MSACKWVHCEGIESFLRLTEAKEMEVNSNQQSLYDNDGDDPAANKAPISDRQ